MLNINKASTNKYNLVFTKLPNNSSITEINQFSLNIYSTVLPGVSLDISDSYFAGKKINETWGSLNYNPFSFDFMVNEDFSNWFTILNWIKHINNNKDTMWAKKSDFLIDCSLLLLDNYNKAFKTITFKNTFPSDLGDITLNKREGENYLESTVTLNYDYFE